MSFHVLLYLSLALCAGALGKDLRIVGGTDADIKQFPFMASLKITGQIQHICAGVIISEKHILSVAHCIYGKVQFFPYIEVYIGISNILDLSKRPLTVQEVHIHPDFNGEKTGKNGYHNDIVIYTLSETIVFDQYQNKIKLPKRDVSYRGTVSIIGWGLTSPPPSSPPTQIQVASVNILSPKDCQEHFTFPILKDELCTYKKNVGICTGDSGGPITKNGKLIGIMSFGTPCAIVPDIHTNVFTHLPFIKSIIKKKKQTG